MLGGDGRSVRGLKTKIQLLSFPDCPNADAARLALLRVLDALGLPHTFETIDTSARATPEALRRWGSPTILVDGEDVASERPTGASCRLYAGSSGVPPDAVISAAVESALRRRRE